MLEKSAESLTTFSPTGQEAGRRLLQQTWFQSHAAHHSIANAPQRKAGANAKGIKVSPGILRPRGLDGELRPLHQAIPGLLTGKQAPEGSRNQWA